MTQESVSGGIPEDMDVTEHNHEVETSDEDEDRGSEASVKSHGEHADNTLIQNAAGSPPGQVNLPSPAVRTRPRRTRPRRTRPRRTRPRRGIRKPARYVDFVKPIKYK